MLPSAMAENGQWKHAALHYLLEMTKQPNPFTGSLFPSNSMINMNNNNSPPTPTTRVHGSVIHKQQQPQQLYQPAGYLMDSRKSLTTTTPTVYVPSGECGSKTAHNLYGMKSSLPVQTNSSDLSDSPVCPEMIFQEAFQQYVSSTSVSCGKYTAIAPCVRQMCFLMESVDRIT
ncbi:unnamed protein product [Echinostoma caproni]|uniref:PIAS1 n=1 Tax=Echinostoma caproni TaxID=27848 RepID=A0A183AS96_9TREM|nr:unnamed protein product [Echinostoma caproni]